MRTSAVIFLAFLLLSCQWNELIESCEADPFSHNRKTIETVEDVHVIIRITANHIPYLEVQDQLSYLNLYFDPKVLKTFAIDALDFNNEAISGVHLIISGAVKESCLGDPLSELSTHPIVITKIEKIKECEIVYEKDETKTYPVKLTFWKFIGFINKDNSINFPPCEENDMYFRLTEESIKDDPEGYNFVAEASSFTCDYKYKDLSENRFLLNYSICILIVPSTTRDAMVFMQRFATALRNPAGVTVEPDHNLLYIYSTVEEATLLFISKE